MKLGRNISQAFRLKLILASEPSMPLSRLSARLRKTAIVAKSIFSHLCTRRIYVQRAQRSQMELLAAQMAIKKRQRSCLPPMKANEGSLHPFHHFPPILTGVAQDRRRSIRSFKLPDAIVEKSNGAYPPTTLDCGTTNYRHPRFGPVI
ncbi:helicase-like protein [Trypanosoma cruzi]|nr:helicase-like protein [Trypanosoma cruzi]